jgi:IclR family transcriptional regulator, acetate operon repressor
MTDDDQRYRLQSVDRALDALEALAAAGQGGLTLTEVAEGLSVSKSTAFSLLYTLTARGYAAESGDRRSRRYRLGMSLAKLGDAAEHQAPLTSLAMPVLQTVTDSTGLTSRLVVPDGPYAVAVARVDAPGTVRFASYLGSREFPHCTSAGKALLAALPPDQARSLAVTTGLPARTPRTITDPDALARDLELTAARGFAIDDEEDCEGVFCVGSAVYDRGGACVAAVSGTGLKLNRSAWQIADLGMAIRDAADSLTSALGGPLFAERRAGLGDVPARSRGSKGEPRGAIPGDTPGPPGAADTSFRKWGMTS